MTRQVPMKLCLAILLSLAVAEAYIVRSKFIELDKNYPLAAEATPFGQASNWKDRYFKLIDERLEVAGTTRLDNAKLSPSDCELRVWVGFSVTLMRGLILRRVAGKWSAVYLAPVTEKTPTRPFTRKLHPPFNGWPSLWNQIIKANIVTLRDQSEFGVDFPDHEAESVVVETKVGDKYRTYHYGNLDQVGVGEVRSIVQFCDLLSREFSLPLRPASL